MNGQYNCSNCTNDSEKESSQNSTLQFLFPGVDKSTWGEQRKARGIWGNMKKGRGIFLLRFLPLLTYRANIRKSLLEYEETEEEETYPTMADTELQSIVHKHRLCKFSSFCSLALSSFLHLFVFWRFSYLKLNWIYIRIYIYLAPVFDSLVELIPAKFYIAKEEHESTWVSFILLSYGLCI